MKPFLSIIIPVYNGSLYLRETIESVLCQPCNDFELLLMDDGSTDGSLEICQSYEGDRVKVFSHANCGVSLTRNEGVERSGGQWIIFCDQDDAMRKDFYTAERKAQMQELLQRGVELIVPGAWWCDAQLRYGTRRFIEKETKCSGIYGGRNDALSWDHMLTFNMCLYARSLFFNADGSATPVRFFALPKDVETTFRHMALYAARKILFSDEYAFCLRRCNEESVSSTWDWMKVYPVVFDAYARLVNWHRTFYPEDRQAIEGAEKALLRRMSFTVDEVGRNQWNLAEVRQLINDYVGESAPWAHLLDKYSDDGQLLRSLLSEPKNVAASYHVSYFKKAAIFCRKALRVITPPRGGQKAEIIRGGWLWDNVCVLEE